MPLDRASIRALTNTLAEIDRLQSEQSIILGSLADRVTRMEALAGALAPLLGVAPDHLIQRLMLSPNCHAAAGQVADELRARCLPVVEWRPTYFGAKAQIGLWRLSVGADRWALRLKIPDSLGMAELIDSGPETGEAGKAAAVAAWRRVCGLEAANPGE